MFKIGTFFYSIKQGVKMLFKNRNFSLAAISTMTACIFLFGIFYFVLTNLQNAIKTAETTVGITVFFDDELPQEDIDRIGEQIKSDVRVGSIEFKSAEQTWQEYKDKYLTGDLAESFGDDNPLENSASYTVYTKNVEYQKEVVAYIKTLAGVRQVNSAESLTDTLQGINTAVMYVSLALIIILLAIATFLISITISMGVSVHKEEISIMRLIGATDYFIRGPFVVEGVIIGLIGAGIPLGLLRLSYDKLTAVAVEKYSSVFETLSFLPAQTLFNALIPIALLVGVGVGFLSSFMTLNRELRKID